MPIVASPRQLHLRAGGPARVIISLGQSLEKYSVIFGLFRDDRLDSFARSLAGELNARVPPKSLEQRVSNPKFEAKLTQAFHHIFLQVRNYRRDHDLGVLKKARLSKIFQDELAALGYGKEFVKEVTLALAEQLTQS